MNKFNVNTQGIEGIGVVKVDGGRIHCTVDDFINMHSAECIEEECGDILYNLRNNVIEKMGYPIDRVSVGKHHPDSLSEDKECFVPMWEGEEYICYVDITKQEVVNSSTIVDGELYTRDVYEVDFNFIIETWDENRFYPRKPI